jgi:hypothetical protein
MKRIDWRRLGEAGDGDLLGFDGLRIVARITKRCGFSYQWYVNDATGFAMRSREAIEICTRMLKEAE